MVEQVFDPMASFGSRQDGVGAIYRGSCEEDERDLHPAELGDQPVGHGPTHDHEAVDAGRQIVNEIVSALAPVGAEDQDALVSLDGLSLEAVDDLG